MCFLCLSSMYDVICMHIYYINILHESIFVCTKDLVYTFVTSVKNKEKRKTENNFISSTVDQILNTECHLFVFSI